MMVLAGSWCAWGGFGWCHLGPALCSLASRKELNYLAPVGAVLRAAFLEITNPSEAKKSCTKKCGRSQGWLIGSHGGVGKQF